MLDPGNGTYHESNSMEQEMKEIMETMPQVGTVRWIGLRPERRTNLTHVSAVEADTDQGLIGDHFSGGNQNKRQVTLIQQEHIAVVASILGRDGIDPNLLRRNIVVSGINLQALKEREFSIGDAVLRATGNCPPCSRMEENLGPGGYNAMRGHGGITANVVRPGKIEVGSEVRMLLSDAANSS